MAEKTTVVIIPAYNEAETIGTLVRQLKQRITDHVIVVDDSSTDSTVTAARASGAVVLPHTIRTGAWGAIRTGFQYAIKQGYQIAVTMDADGQHLPDAVPAICDHVSAGRSDIAIGSCPFRASLARRIAWAFFRKISRLEINDLTSGFRAYNQQAFSALASIETSLLDYQDVGVLIFLQKKGFTITEIPVTMCQRISGHSRIFSSWAAVFRYLVLTGVLCFSKFK